MGGTEYSINLHDPKHDTDDEIAERVAWGNALTAEVLPDEAPTPVDVAIAQVRASPERYKRWSFRARDAGGNLAGMASTSIDPDHDDNPDVLWASINIAAGHRRSGLATQLLARLVEVAETEGRDRFVGHSNDLFEGSPHFAAAVGAEEKSKTHANRLMIADVDRSLMETWVSEGPARAEGYELIGWDGPVPEEYMDKWLDLVLVMNTAPRDDLKINDFTLTAEEVRESERVFAAAGGEMWTLVARRIDDDAWAGFHNVEWAPSDPKVVWVDSTGVRPEHRGHALGKWLKAVMTLRVVDERPDVREIRTGNADSNDAMLGINWAMGYKPWIAQSTWEVSVERAKAYLTARGVTSS